MATLPVEMYRSVPHHARHLVVVATLTTTTAQRRFRKVFTTRAPIKYNVMRVAYHRLSVPA